MPNHNYNQLTITGTKGNIRKFITRHMDEQGDLDER